MRILSACRCLALMLLPICWLAAAATAGEKHETVMVLSNPARPLTVPRGETFTIVVAANPTTGYGWQLAEPLDGRVLQLVTTEYQNAASALDGAGGREIWRFVALQAGTTTIALKYVRPWEKDRPPAKKAVFTVMVQ